MTIIKAISEKDILNQFYEFLTKLEKMNLLVNCEEFFRVKLYLIIEEEDCYYKLMIPVK